MMVNQRHRYVSGQRLDKIELLYVCAVTVKMASFRFMVCEQGVSLSGVHYSLISVNYFVKFNKITDCLYPPWVIKEKSQLSSQHYECFTFHT